MNEPNIPMNNDGVSFKNNSKPYIKRKPAKKESFEY